MTDTYTVVFRGDLVPGTTPGEVRQRLQEFFRLDDARVERLFSGRPVAIRKNIELDRARQLRDMLAAMGALAEVRGGDGKAAIAASSAAVGDGLAAVTVAPPGADILRPEERRPVYCRDIATGHLSVDRAGGDVLKPHERRRPMALQIDLSHLEISSLDLEAVPSAGPMSDEDSELFKAFVGEVEPLKTPETVDQHAARTVTPGMRERRRAAEQENIRAGNYLAALDHIGMVKPWDELSFKRDGVQHGVFKNLRQGRYALDARLDLHRLSVEQARHAVFEFVSDCVAHNIRCALITHGKGELRDNPALLKSCTNHWLRQIDAVLAFHSAQRHHGGYGATYVLLRKSDEKRQENKEMYSKRRT